MLLNIARTPFQEGNTTVPLAKSEGTCFLGVANTDFYPARSSITRET